MTFFIITVVFMYIGRRGGWILSRLALYPAPASVAIPLCALWGCATALSIFYLILWLHPGIVLRIIMGYALGWYVSIPDYGLFDRSTLPHDANVRETFIDVTAFASYVILSIALALHRFSPHFAIPVCAVLISATAIFGIVTERKELQRNGFPKRRTPTGNDTPLHEATARGLTDEVKALLESGARVNAPGFNRDTPLHDAALYKHPDTARLLLEAGASVKAQNSDGETALHQAAHDPSGEIAKILLEQGANANARNRKRETPLLLATMLGNAPMVALLLKYGADVNVADKKEGFTPLHHAIMSLDSEWGIPSNVDRSTWLHIGAMLIERGANPNARDRRGLSVLDYKHLSLPELAELLSHDVDSD